MRETVRSTSTNTRAACHATLVYARAYLLACRGLGACFMPPVMPPVAPRVVPRVVRDARRDRIVCGEYHQIVCQVHRRTIGSRRQERRRVWGSSLWYPVR